MKKVILGCALLICLLPSFSARASDELARVMHMYDQGQMPALEDVVGWNAGRCYCYNCYSNPRDPRTSAFLLIVEPVTGGYKVVNGMLSLGEPEDSFDNMTPEEIASIESELDQYPDVLPKLENIDDRTLLLGPSGYYNGIARIHARKFVDQNSQKIVMQYRYYNSTCSGENCLRLYCELTKKVK